MEKLSKVIHFLESSDFNDLNCGTIKDIEPLRGDASSRSYYRIYLQDETQILCVYPDNGIEIFKRFNQTTDFLQQNLSSSHKQWIPKIRSSSEKSLWILQEDIGETSIYDWYHQQEKSIAYEELKKIWEKLVLFILDVLLVKTPEEIPSWIRKGKNLNSETLFQECTLTNQYYLKDYLELDQAEIKIFEQDCKKALSNLRIDGLAHRDFHSKNIHLDNQGLRISIIDYQDLMGAPRLYDFVSFIEDPYLNLSQNFKSELIQIVKDEFSRKGLMVENFQKEYHLVAFQRVYKAIGTYTMKYFSQRNPFYLTYLENSQKNLLKHIEELNSLEGDCFKDSRPLIQKIKNKFQLGKTE